MVKHIPNSITLINLFSGCCGIVACLQHQYMFVPILIGFSLIADFLDGFVARTFRIKSELGGQLDSLADMVTFGVLPGIMLYSIIDTKGNLSNPVSSPFLNNPYALLGFIYTIFACLRLAKFNLDTRQTVDFIGLNTPSCAIFVLGFYMQFFTDWNNRTLWDFTINSKVAAMIIPFILAFLMVAEFRMFSLKGNPFSWKENKMRVLFLVSAIPQFILLGWLSLSTVIISYVVFAFLNNMMEKKAA